MLSLIYNLLFMPIELLVEMTYSVVHRLLGNEGLSIIAVSLVIQTLVLPLYKRADAMQDEERQRQKDMEHWVNHIKKTFKGDERYMMLSTYYREQNYKSWYAIKSSASILLQIPFFTAAYRFLSNLNELSGVSFLFIKDLSKPDMSFAIGGFSVNVLPILMTLINIVSGIIYTRNLKFREKAQVYGLAVVFLVLLYNSPSGLVLYWTMNNTYSLIKNIVIKILQGKLHLFEKKAITTGTKSDIDDGSLYRTYILGAIFLTFFIGGVVLLNVVNSSASEFVNYEHGPIYLVISNMMIFGGIFIVWGSVFYALMTSKARKVFTKIIIAISAVSVVDFMFFGLKMGRMSPLFEYEKMFSFSMASKLINLLVVLFAAVAVILLCNKKVKLIKNVMLVMALSVIAMSAFLMFGVNKQVQEYKRNQEMTRAASDDRIFNLSSEKKNVIVIMIDRAVSGFIPYIFDEKPEIAKMYEGFTYYPQTISFGSCTNFCTPGLFGGYEYTPEAMNNRSDESLKDKHNEALLLMPALFSENGYDVTVCDPPYAGNYEMVNDLSIYDQYDNVKAYNTKGAYMADVEKYYASSYQAKQENMAFYYSVMKVIPVAIQQYLYNGGGYCSKKEITVNRKFLETYSSLLKLSDLTAIDKTERGGFLLIQNETTHEGAVLSVPDYVPVEGAKNKIEECAEYYNTVFSNEECDIKLDSLTNIAFYHSNLATIRALGEWFEFLKENNCWDNTRVIIVSDHGNELDCFDEMIFSNGLEVIAYNPILMVKDFDSSSYTVSEEFMTIADVPCLALDGVIENAVNPFTGKKISMEEKQYPQKVTTSHKYLNKNSKENTFDTDDGEWYQVIQGSIFDEKNWILVDD